jgi:uncharacterized protein (DUF2236 family)
LSSLPTGEEIALAYDGMYDPDTVTWRVGREAALLVGGGRALILQVAHPLVAAGVEQHSRYDTDPWGRLYRTIDVTTRIAFGDRQTSAEAAAALRRVHARVTGTAADGTPYKANRPDLLLWVWATLLDTSLLVYRRYVGYLTRDEVHRYYQEQSRFAVACGVPAGAWPHDYQAFREYFESTVEDDLHPTEDSRRIAAAVLGSGVPLPLRPVSAALNLATVGLLPPTVRERFGYGWGPGRGALLEASSFTLRQALRLLPSPLRELPAARAASRRTA